MKYRNLFLKADFKTTKRNRTMYKTTMKDLIKELASKGYAVDFKKDSYLNIARKDGTNCEFYPCDTYLTGNYQIDGIEKDIDVDISQPLELDDFIVSVSKILEVK